MAALFFVLDVYRFPGRKIQQLESNHGKERPCPPFIRRLPRPKGTRHTASSPSLAILIPRLRLRAAKQGGLFHCPSKLQKIASAAIRSMQRTVRRPIRFTPKPPTRKRRLQGHFPCAEAATVTGDRDHEDVPKDV